MKILLTGTTGQVGHELARVLGKHGELIVADRSRMDLAKPDSIRECIRTVQPQLIVNPAAYTAVDQAEKETALAMQINGIAPGIMAEEAAKLGAAMIHYSTDYVFDGDKQGAYIEEDVPNPQNAYGSSKLAGERAVQAAGIPHVILRTSWVYGLNGKNFLMTIRRLARERDQLRIVADQFGAPTWSRTIAQATASVIADLGDPTSPEQRAAWLMRSGTYHLAAQGQTNWCDFARAIVAHDGLREKVEVVPITTAEYPLPAKRPANSVLSCDKFIRLFGALPAWDQALRDCLHSS